MQPPPPSAERAATTTIQEKGGGGGQSAARSIASAPVTSSQCELMWQLGGAEGLQEQLVHLLPRGTNQAFQFLVFLKASGVYLAGL